jgi:hypothetical protein
MPTFTIEMTSSNGWAPSQYTVEADSPGEAVVKALRDHQYGVERGLDSLVEPYDKESDPNGSYTGWSRITISLDGQVGEDGSWVREGDDG